MIRKLDIEQRASGFRLDGPTTANLATNRI
jgi:hypothetical protein